MLMIPPKAGFAGQHGHGGGMRVLHDCATEWCMCCSGVAGGGEEKVEVEVEEEEEEED
jgi:hypothetical protein